MALKKGPKHVVVKYIVYQNTINFVCFHGYLYILYLVFKDFELDGVWNK